MMEFVMEKGQTVWLSCFRGYLILVDFIVEGTLTRKQFHTAFGMISTLKIEGKSKESGILMKLKLTQLKICSTLTE